MRLEKIFIRNFRSIGEEGLTINFSKNLTTIVGENNVGKSSIFEAVNKILEKDPKCDEEDWHAGDMTKTIEIRIECALNDEQIKSIINFLKFPLKSAVEFKKNFGDKVVCLFEVEYRNNTPQPYLYFTLGELWLSTSQGWFGGKDRLKSLAGHKPYAGVYQEIQASKKFVDSLKEILLDKSTTIDFGGFNITEDFCKILRQYVVIIEEFREKPQQSKNNVLVSPTGRELSNILNKLHSGRPKQKATFEKIKQKFNQFFPQLELYVVEEEDKIKILTKKSGIESTTDFIGFGVLETLQIITHAIAHDDKVLLIDSPEVHLHPHIQRHLGSFIGETAENSQTIIITHSPYFVDINENSSILRFIQKNEQTNIIEVSIPQFNEKDFFKLYKVLNIECKELFFAKKALLVEGSTEFGALPVFAPKFDYGFDENGISIVNAGGKNGFEIFVKLCESAKMPYLVVADEDPDDKVNDTQKILNELEHKYRNFKSRIVPRKFDEHLDQKLQKEAESVVGKRSKPRIGRYVALKTLELKKPIPEEVKTIIDWLKGIPPNF